MRSPGFSLVELEPDNAQYRNNLGNTLYAMKRYKEALAEMRKAVELEPDNAQYHSVLNDMVNKTKQGKGEPPEED